MKRIASFVAVAVLVFSCLVTTSFAKTYPTDGYPPKHSNDDASTHAMYWEWGSDYGVYLISASDSDKMYYNSEKQKIYVKSGHSFELRDAYFSNGSWGRLTSYTKSSNSMVNSIDGLYYCDFEIYDESGNLYREADVDYCDGTACPANDLDHNNVCDDCGLVLTMSLRSSLWDYAQSVVANGMDIFDSDYWVITDNGADGYKIYIASVPFKYNASSDTLTSTGVVQRTEVYDTSDGSYIGGTSWASKQPNTALDVGDPVATSHPIEGFFPIPLWMEMDRLTQGEMVTMGQTLGGMMKILVPCGVGCLALLMVLKLFGKRSLIFRN